MFKKAHIEWSGNLKRCFIAFEDLRQSKPSNPRRYIFVLCISLCFLLLLVSQDALAITRDKAIEWLSSWNGTTGGIDLPGNSGGYQCTDFVSGYMNYLVNGDPYNVKYPPLAPGNYPTRASQDADLWQVINNYGSFIPEPGDIFVSSGHVGVVISSINNTKATVVDQNARAGYNDVTGTLPLIHEITWTAKGSGAYGVNYFIRFKQFEPIPAPTPEIRGSEMTVGYDRELPDGNYMITTAADPQYFLDIAGGDVPAKDGTNVQLWWTESDVGENDAWTIKYANGFYRITQYGNSTSLDVSGSDTLRGKNVQVWGYIEDSAGQQWAVSKNWIQDGPGKGYRLEARCSNYSLDYESGKLAKEVNVSQWEDVTGDGQKWLFIPYKPSQTVPQGRYILLSGKDDSFELDVSGDSDIVENGTNVQLWKDIVNSRTNAFDIIPLNNGYYKIIHAVSGKALDVNGASTISGENIHLWDFNGGIAQQWAITPQGNGFMLRARCSGYAMDLEDGKLQSGQNVRQLFYNGSSAQTWKLVPAEYKVKYVASEAENVPSEQIKYYKTNLVLSTAKPTREGYTFLGWSTSSTATTATYQPGATYSADASVTLYAIWKEDIKCPIDETHFPDAVFREYVKSFDTNNDGNLSARECEKVTYIGVPEKGITSLQGVEYFTKLTSLSCYRNALTELDVSRNTALTSLSCHTNALTALDVSKNIALKELYCSDNALTVLNISNNTMLADLNCGGNNLKALDVRKNTALMVLYCDNTNLTELDVSKNTALEILSCSYNDLAELDVSKNTLLTTLVCHKNALTELDVSGNTALKLLYCYENTLTKLDVSRNTALTALNCRSQQIKIPAVYTGEKTIYTLGLGYDEASFGTGVYNAQTGEVRFDGKVTSFKYNYPIGYNNQMMDVKVSAVLSMQTYTVTYNANGGTGVPASQTKTAGAALTLSTTKPTREGYTFLGWSMSSTSTTAAYQPGDTYSTDASVTLYAVWQSNSITVTYYTIVYDANGGEGAPSKQLKREDGSIVLSSVIPTREGYIFLGWATSPTATVAVYQPGETMYKNDCWLYAVWKKDEISIAIDETHFPDAIFCEYVKSFDTDKNGGLSVDERAVVTSIDVSYMEIQSLKGIECFIELTQLDCSYNELTELEISSNLSLQQLNCSDNELSNLDVSKNTALTELNCSWNELTALDLVNNLYLTALDCSGNEKLSSLDTSKNTALLSLDCSGCIELKSLDVSKNTALTYLDCGYIGLTELNVQNNTQLTELHCVENYDLSEIDLSKNTKLEVLNCSACNIPKLDLRINTALQRLTCDQCELTELYVDHIATLAYLYCPWNKLDMLDLSGCSALDNLQCRETGLKSLNLSECTSLTRVDCYGNSLMSLDMSDCTSLERLSCHGNELESLDVSMCLALETLMCEGNNLTALDLSNNTELGCLTCGWNNLTALDLSKNTEMYSLDCSDNQLETLDLSRNTKLEDLCCYNNALTELNVSKNRLLNRIECSPQYVSKSVLGDGSTVSFRIGTGLQISNLSDATYNPKTGMVTLKHPTANISYDCITGFSEEVMRVEVALDYSEIEADFTLPKQLKIIGEEAFAGAPIRILRIPNGVTTIDAMAFADCANLLLIFVPDSVTSIADNAFDGCLNVAFVCSDSSAASSFAEEHGIPCM